MNCLVLFRASRAARRRMPLFAAAALLAVPVSSQVQQVTVVWSQGRETMPVSHFAGVPVVALDDVAHFVGAALTAGGDSATLTVGGRTATVATGRSFVPVGGQLVLLSAPATVRGDRWFVPLDFLGKVLPVIATEKVIYRDDARLLVIGTGFPHLSVRTFPYPAYTRVVIEASAPLAFSVDQTPGQVRVRIATDYLESDFREERMNDGVVDHILLSRIPEGYLLSVELGERFGTLKAFELANPSRLVLDLFRTRVPSEAVTGTTPPLNLPPSESPPDPNEGVPTPEAPPPRVAVEPPLPLDSGLPPGPGREQEPGRLHIVTLDPGHGGEESGATGPQGVQEKQVTLTIAQRLRDLLEDRLGVRVLLTRDDDRELSLDQRTEIANTNGSDLFISIHANASPRRTARGSEVYYLSYEASDDDSRRLAAAENLGVARTGSAWNQDLEFILWDMAQAAHLNESASLAETILEELLSEAGESRNRGIKQAPFRVLMGATMPAVLIEVGFITNPEEERLLSSGDYQNRLAQAIFRGVLRYKERYERLLGQSGGTSRRSGR